MLLTYSECLNSQGCAGIRESGKVPTDQVHLEAAGIFDKNHWEELDPGKSDYS